MSRRTNHRNRIFKEGTAAALCRIWRRSEDGLAGYPADGHLRQIGSSAIRQGKIRPIVGDARVRQPEIAEEIESAGCGRKELEVCEL